MVGDCVRWPIYNDLNIVILESGNKYFTERFADMAVGRGEKCLWEYKKLETNIQAKIFLY